MRCIGIIVIIIGIINIVIPELFCHKGTKLNNDQTYAENKHAVIDFFLFVYRDNLKILLNDVNHQKKILKEEGIIIDGIELNVEFLGKNRFSFGLCFSNSNGLFFY